MNVARAGPSKEVYETSIFFGTVRPSRSSSLGFLRGGRIAKVYTKVGDSIDEGEKIAELEQDELKRQQEELDKSLSDARTQLSAFQSRNNRQQVARVQQDIARLTTQQDELARKLSLGIILAPYSAHLVEAKAVVGDLVPSGRTFFRIAEDVQPIVEVNLPALAASNIEVGQDIWVEKGGELVRASVASKSPELDPSSRTQLVILRLQETEDDIKWTFGEVIEVRLWVSSQNSGIWIPYSALQRQGEGLWSVYVVDGEGEYQTVGQRILEIIQLEDQHALVRGSLEEGDLYVVDGLNRLVPGQKVEGELVEREFLQLGPPGVGE